MQTHTHSHRYPALQWQLRAARRAVHRAAVVGGWLRERAVLTRYAHVPLADLGGDPSLAIADALYARCLRAAGHALWVRDPALPDPGEWEQEVCWCDSQGGKWAKAGKKFQILGGLCNQCLGLGVQHTRTCR